MEKGRGELIHRVPFSTLHFRVQWNISNPFFFSLSFFRGNTPLPPPLPRRIERQSTRPVSAACSCVRYHLIGWAFGHEGRRTYEKEEERIERFEHAPYSIRFRRVDAFDSFLFSRVSRHEQGVCALSLLSDILFFFFSTSIRGDKLLLFFFFFLINSSLFFSSEQLYLWKLILCVILIIKKIKKDEYNMILGNILIFSNFGLRVIEINWTCWKFSTGRTQMYISGIFSFRFFLFILPLSDNYHVSSPWNSWIIDRDG